jgi:hypothetical protein
MVDSTPPFDWEAQETDGDRKVIKPGSPLTHKFMEDSLMGYLDYVYGSEDQSKPDAYPGLVASGVIDKNQEFFVEVEVYRSLAASRLSKHLDITNQRSPLYSLANVMTKYALSDAHGYVGKNWMVDGVVVLTEDKQPEAKGGDWTDRNLVTNVLIDGPRANFHSIYEAADGGIVKVHPGLDRVLEQRADQENTAKDKSAPSSSEPAPSLTAVGAAFEDDGATFFSASTQAALAAAEAAPAAEPAAEEAAPAPAAEEAAAPAASTSAGGRFTRRST